MFKRFRKEKGKIKAVIFDIGGVLSLGKGETIGKTNKTLGVHEHVSKHFDISLDQWLDSIDTTYADAIKGAISDKKAISVIARNMKTTPQKLERVLLNAYKNHFEQNEKLYQFAFALKKQGYKIGILSDQWYVSKKALAKKDYMKKFDSVVISCDVGCRKPDTKIYKLVLSKLKVKPEEMVFIDNQTWNLKPAKKLRMKTVLFKNNKQAIKELYKLGVRLNG